jgi:hypothetical protein
MGCTHVLDINGLASEQLNKLRSLELSQVKVSRDHFLSIMERNESALKSLFLQYVELRSGKWIEVPLGLCRLPQLYLSMCSMLGMPRIETLPSGLRTCLRRSTTLETYMSIVVSRCVPHAGATSVPSLFGTSSLRQCLKLGATTTRHLCSRTYNNNRFNSVVAFKVR